MNTWTESDSSLLLNLKNKGVSYIELGKVFPNRTIDSLRNHYWQLTKQNKLKFEKEAKVLVLDIETSLMIFSAWGTGQQYLSDTNIIDDWFILSYAAKWLGEEKIYSDVLTSTEAKKKNDKRLCKSLWSLLDEADIILGHNSDKFDIKKINTRFLYHRIPLPRPAKGLDTLKLARKVFAFSSNKLDYICKYLGLEAKSEHNGYQTWLECLKGNEEELKTLAEYNKNDVIILENLYNVLKDGLTGIKKPKHGWKAE